MSGLTFDAGALIAFERNERAVVAMVGRVHERGERIAVPAGVVAQVWRDGRRQVRLVRLLASALVDVLGLDDQGARAAGQIMGLARTTDVVDAAVAVCARQRAQPVVTSDPADLRRIDPGLRVVAV